MVDRFLRYSMERQTKIAAVLLLDGQMTKKNLRVTAIDPDGGGFCALLPGRKRETHFAMTDVLTAAYARGDHGEIEEVEG